jgi:rsbT antagonist protein RsbS
MTSNERSGRIPLQLTRSCVVASIQVDLDAEVLDSFRKDLLALIHGSGAQGVILDLAGVEVLDREDFDELRKTMQMASLMGGRCLLAGLRPGVVSALVDLGVDTGGVTAVANLDEAFRLMEDHLAQVSSSDGVDECEEPEDGEQDASEARDSCDEG